MGTHRQQQSGDDAGAVWCEDGGEPASLGEQVIA